ncbi:MAG: 16S rRNA (cytosine(1402)-N(4))-methyltransferase RsmH [bacterium]
MADQHSRAFGHIPVMAEQAVAALSPVDGGVYIDATMGGGGYTRMIFGQAGCHIYGFDRDLVAIERAAPWAGAYAGRLHLINQPFGQMEQAMVAEGVTCVNGVVFDLGVSSLQLDQSERGFSFSKEGPLNMRMDSRVGQLDAAVVVNEASEKDLADILYIYGEEKRSRRIAQAIVEHRKQADITTTKQLATIILDSIGQRGDEKIHPATRTFQAIRIFVNDELGELVRGLLAAEKLLAPAARLVVVTFHSLEDRIVKRFLALRSGKVAGGSRHAPEISTPLPASFKLLSRRAILASAEEVAANPRARSAKLRVGIRTNAPLPEKPSGKAFTDFLKSLGLPQPSFSQNLSKWSTQ